MIVGDSTGKFGKGFSVNFTKVRDAVRKCEDEMREKRTNAECKRIFKELDIDVLE